MSCFAALLSVFQHSILPIPPSVLFSPLERMVQMACLGLSIQLSFVLSILSSHNGLTIHVSTHRQTLLSSLIRAAPPWVNGSKHRHSCGPVTASGTDSGSSCHPGLLVCPLDLGEGSIHVNSATSKAISCPCHLSILLRRGFLCLFHPLQPSFSLGLDSAVLTAQRAW